MSLINITIKAYDNAKLDELISLTQSIGGNMADLQADIDLLTAQLQKVQAEVTASNAAQAAAAQALTDQIAALQAIIDAGQPVVNLDGLKAIAASLDDINPDVIV